VVKVPRNGPVRCRISHRAIQILITAALLRAPADVIHAQQSRAPFAQTFPAREKIAAPIVLCIDDKPTAGSQPSAGAYAKAAAHGFRSILTLRSPGDGVDPLAERFMVERNKLRYFNIPATTELPNHERIEEFLRLTRDNANHPMLINCAFAERVAPLMTIFRIVEQGWSEEKALEEAARTGGNREQLRMFVREYLKQRKPRRN
jgi:protein tyrosine phosphatase (PTP) superfamily phosphohydrolase (DUF442 family)